MSFRTAFTGFRNEAASATFRSRPTGGAGGAAGAGRRAYTQGGMYQGPSAFRKWAVRLALTIAFPAAYFTGAVFPPKIVLLLYPRYAPPPPAGDSPQGKALMGETEKDLQKLWIVARLRTREGWYETRPYARFDPDKIHNSLTAGSLRGPGKLAVPPIVFSKDDESEAIAVLHLGRALCGHDGIIHGGIISTVFDESLARNALLNLPTHIGVTANLNVNYRSPLHADQFVVVRTKLDSVNGRKVMVSGTMETLEGEKIAEATALFVEPKWANFLQSSGVTAALGRPLPSSSPATTPAVYASKAN
ncbi:HotDog domain-containing protein [Dioszegia hungarica]|uniref:HotDog domain-containing protein n=1 Tax=Dioszegia hungarica TaxID=4972 RepID=A0AA38H8H6_9TREE|nr:HotDog domain-containing protein [Dioszegia hungarica]KAI9636278.1 HotDog domain-containing protein [Dioszegia hungarica]